MHADLEKHVSTGRISAELAGRLNFFTSDKNEMRQKWGSGKESVWPHTRSTVNHGYENKESHVYDLKVTVNQLTTILERIACCNDAEDYYVPMHVMTTFHLPTKRDGRIARRTAGFAAEAPADDYNARPKTEVIVGTYTTTPSLYLKNIPIRSMYSDGMRRIVDRFCPEPRPYSFYSGDDGVRHEERIESPTCRWVVPMND